MKIASIVTGAVLISTLFTAGCTSTGARRISSGGTESIVTLNQIDIQDWMDAANQMVDSLLTSGRIEQEGSRPAVMVISRITNKTQLMVDTDSLVKKIRVQLNKSGKVVTTTTMGLRGKSEDPLAKSQAEYEAFMNDKPVETATVHPDYSLSGKLLEQRASAGRDKQVTYSFQLSLTEIATGLAVWEDEVMITKAGRRNSVGW